jgi:hypothetical protein
MAITATPRVHPATAFTPPLLLAFALGVNPWKLGGTTGAAQRPRERHVPAGDGHTVWEERRRAKRRLGWLAEARGVRSAAAGREGVWRHRFCVSQGVEHSVVDAASIAVTRRDRRAHTDRLEVPKLLPLLLRHAVGDKQVWSGVRVPSVGEEDRRQLILCVVQPARLSQGRLYPRTTHKMPCILGKCLSVTYQEVPNPTLTP